MVIYMFRLEHCFGIRRCDRAKSKDHRTYSINNVQIAQNVLTQSTLQNSIRKKKLISNER